MSVSTPIIGNHIITKTNMRKLFWIVSVALLALTACDKEVPVTDPAGIAMIVKNGQIDYFRQIESSFRNVCQEKGL